MHIAERAIIMAAGIGSRMYPVTLSTPKPLVTVNGKRIIDTVIDALHQNGIYEIYVVVGYLKEKFAALLLQYPELELIENPYYSTSNNISSLYVAREHLGNCLILDGDQIIYNTDILNPQFTLSGYNAVWCENNTDEWLMNVKDGVVQSCSRMGGSYGWQLYSISRWSEEDGKRLRRHVEIEFEEKQNCQIYWDDIPLFCYLDEYTLGIKEMKTKDITEIDSLYELVMLDPRYKSYLTT